MLWEERELAFISLVYSLAPFLIHLSTAKFPCTSQARPGSFMTQEGSRRKWPGDTCVCAGSPGPSSKLTYSQQPHPSTPSPPLSPSLFPSPTLSVPPPTLSVPPGSSCCFFATAKTSDAGVGRARRDGKCQYGVSPRPPYQDLSSWAIPARSLTPNLPPTTLSSLSPPPPLASFRRKCCDSLAAGTLAQTLQAASRAVGPKENDCTGRRSVFFKWTESRAE